MSILAATDETYTVAAAGLRATGGGLVGRLVSDPVSPE